MKVNFKALKRLLVLALALILVFSVFTGCGKKKRVSEKSVDTQVSKYEDGYPIETETTLTIWRTLTAHEAALVGSYAEFPIAEIIKEKTGVSVEYVEPSVTNSTQQFNLMRASGNLSDIIDYNWNYFEGGPEAAMAEGLIIDMTDAINAWAPDLKAKFDAYPEVAREAKTDTGKYFATGIIAQDRKLNTSAGPIVRMDWMEELGFTGENEPETIDDWYEVLKAFKEKKGAKAPYTDAFSGLGNGMFIGAYHISYDFYNVDGEVKFGPAQPEYKEFLKTMKKWYDEGLYDENFSTVDAATIKQQMLDGTSGLHWNALGGGIGQLITAAEQNGSSARFGGMRYPKAEGDERPWFGQASNKFSVKSSISGKCKDPELAMRYLNYGYTEEGDMLYNFGVEGKSYEWIDKNGEKYPQYTEYITNNPDGLTMSQALSYYSQAGQSGNYEQTTKYLEQYAGKPEQQEAWVKWVDTDTFEHRVPNTGVATEDAQDYSELYTLLTTHRDENYIKFVNGTRSLDEFDEYVKELEEMGLKRCTEIKQEAYERFLAR